MRKIEPKRPVTVPLSKMILSIICDPFDIIYISNTFLHAFSASILKKYLIFSTLRYFSILKNYKIYTQTLSIIVPASAVDSILIVFYIKIKFLRYFYFCFKELNRLSCIILCSTCVKSRPPAHKLICTTCGNNSCANEARRRAIFVES